jgi:hypothetical protein
VVVRLGAEQGCAEKPDHGYLPFRSNQVLRS